MKNTRFAPSQPMSSANFDTEPAVDTIQPLTDNKKNDPKENAMNIIKAWNTRRRYLRSLVRG